MSTTSLEVPRDELVDCWVTRDALSIVLDNVGHVCEHAPKNTQDIASELAGPLFDRLWPAGEGEGPNAVEHARSAAFAASMLAGLTTDRARERLLREAARLAALAGENLEDTARDA